MAYIFNPKLTATELLQTVCAEFGLAPAPEAGAAKIEQMVARLAARVQNQPLWDGLERLGIARDA